MSGVLKPGKKLKDDNLWRLAMQLAEISYDLLPDFPEEEKWGMQAKLRQRAFELTSDIAEAIGSIDPRDKVHAYGLARRSLFGIKNVYSVSSKSEVMPVDLDLMIKIDKMIDILDTEITKATENIQIWYEEFDDARKKQK